MDETGWVSRNGRHRLHLLSGQCAEPVGGFGPFSCDAGDVLLEFSFFFLRVDCELCEVWVFFPDKGGTTEAKNSFTESCCPGQNQIEGDPEQQDRWCFSLAKGLKWKVHMIVLSCSIQMIYSLSMISSLFFMPFQTCPCSSSREDTSFCQESAQELEKQLRTVKMMIKFAQARRKARGFPNFLGRRFAAVWVSGSGSAFLNPKNS